MEQHPISTIQEKIVGIEAVFSTLGSGEQENAVGILEEYLKKLRGQIKPTDSSSLSQPTPAQDDSSPIQNDIKTKTTEPKTKSTQKRKQKEKEKATPSTKSPRKAKVQPAVIPRVRTVSTRGRRAKFKLSLAESEDENNLNEPEKIEEREKPRQGKKRGRPSVDKNVAKASVVKNIKTEVASDKVDPVKPVEEQIHKRKKIKPIYKSETKGKRVYIQKKIFECKGCGEDFYHYKTMAVHLRTHGSHPMCCRFCRSELINEIELLHHDCQVRSKKKYSCPSCGEEFLKKKLCKVHVFEKHNLKYSKVMGQGSKNVCKFCNRTFVRKVSLYMHYKLHAETSFVCLKCGEICDTFNTFTEHMKLHDMAASFECEKCGTSFERRQQYSQHLVGHMKYDCTECNMFFTQNAELKRHRRSVHGDTQDQEAKRYECLICGKKFLRPMQLEIHTRIHTGERPLECTTCQLSFRTTKALAKHKQTYNHCVRSGFAVQEKKYLCSECGKAYFRKQALQRHIRYHTGDKPHTCQYCGYKCREQNNLKRHIALHFENLRNFICEVCGAAFHAKKTLEMHFKYKHTEIRDFQCPECPMSFKAKNALKRHVNTHEKTKDHKCWCGSAFGRMYNLRRHMRMVHGDEESLPPVRKVTVLDAEFAVKQAIKTPPAKKRICKPKHIQPVTTTESETVIMNVVHDQMSAETVHANQTMYSIPHQHQVVPHLTEQEQPQHNVMYDTVTIPSAMVTYHHNAPPAPPIGAETVIDTRTQQQHQQQQHHPAADYYNNPGMLEAQANDYNNPYMYIQNVLLPSVAMAGLLDLSHAPPPPPPKQ